MNASSLPPPNTSPSAAVRRRRRYAGRERHARIIKCGIDEEKFSLVCPHRTLHSAAEFLLDSETEGAGSSAGRGGGVRLYMRRDIGVGIGFYLPEDVFVLFLAAENSLPLIVAQFDRDGQEDDGDRPTGPRTPPGSWTDAVAAVLLSAAIECGGSFPASIPSEDLRLVPRQQPPPTDGTDNGHVASRRPSEDNDGEDDDDGDDDGSKNSSLPDEDSYADVQESDGSSSDEEEKEGGPDGDTDAEVEALRLLIVDELLYPKKDSTQQRVRPSRSVLHHPDPNFMAPLAKALSAQLVSWRQLSRNRPENVPVIPNAAAGEDVLELKKRKDIYVLSSGMQRRRTGQVRESAELVGRALGRLSSLLDGTDDGGAPPASRVYDIGREIAQAELAVIKLHSGHRECWNEWTDALLPEKWSYECYLLLRNIEKSSATCPRTVASALRPWLECVDGASERSASDDSIDSDRGSESSPKAAPIEALKEVVSTWVTNDLEFYSFLSETGSLLRDAMQKKEAISVARGELISARNKLDEVKERILQDNKRILQNFAEICNADHKDSDGEEEDLWLRDTFQPKWSRTSTEAYFLLGGHGVGAASSLKLVLDCISMRRSLENGLSNMQSTASIYDEDGVYLPQNERFSHCWKTRLGRILQMSLDAVERFMEGGDCKNAFLVLVVCMRFLCNRGTAASLRSHYTDKHTILAQIRDAMQEFDLKTIKLSFSLFDEVASREHGDNLRGNTSCSLGPDAEWLYALFMSGELFFPRIEKVQWSLYQTKDRPSWVPHAHVAAAVFDHGGWSHPLLCRALSGDTDALHRWQIREAPVVLKERFNALKAMNRTTAEIIAMARMLGGDQDALQFLISHGRTDFAVNQASSSGSKEGLGALAVELRATDPCTSFLCAQAELLSATEGKTIDESESGENDDVASKSNLMELFVKRLLVENTDTFPPKDGVPSTVTSLYFLSSMAAVRVFLGKAKSTTDMQALLQQYAGVLAASDSFLASAALAIIFQTTSFRMIGHALSLSGILVVGDGTGRSFRGSSGRLTKFENDPSAPVNEQLVALSAACFECTKYFLEDLLQYDDDRFRQCGTIFLVGALLSALQLANQFGCPTWAMQILDMLKECEGTLLETVRPGPLDMLAYAFCQLYNSRSHKLCQGVLSSLLDLFFDLKVDNTYLPCQIAAKPWVALAYAEYRGPCVAGTRLAEHIFHSETRKRKFEHNLEKVVGKAFDIISVVDEQDVPVLGHVMTPYALSDQRQKLTEGNRAEVCAAFFQRLLDLSGSSGKVLSPSTIARLVKGHVSANASSWHLDADNLVQEMTNALPSLLSCLSRQENIISTCRVLYFVDKSLENGEDWSSSHFILGYGLRWLRSASSSTQLPIFDLRGDNILKRFCRKDVTENWRRLFSESDWDSGSAYNYGISYSHEHSTDERELAVYGLAIIVRHYATMLQDSAPSELWLICQEAIILCEAFQFWLRPSIARFRALLAKNKTLASRSQGNIIIPGCCEPTNLLNCVLKAEWGVGPDCSELTGGNHHSPHGQAISIPLFTRRVLLAVSEQQVSAAAVLCTKLGKNPRLWKKYDEWEMRHSSSSIGLSFCVVALGCLRTLRAAAVSSEAVEAEFSSISSHIIVQINWLGICESCWPLAYEENDLLCGLEAGLAPSADMIDELNNCAAEWEKATITPDNDLGNCIKLVCALSRVSAAFRTTFKRCPRCPLHPRLPRDQESETDDEKETDACRGSEEPLRKRRRTESVKEIVSLLHQLHSLAQELHTKKASVWFTLALQRIGKRNSKTV